MSASHVEPAEAHDLVITRTLRAPRQALWRAWTDRQPYDPSRHASAMAA